MAKEMTISTVGYRASDTNPNGYEAQVFSTVILVDDESVQRLEQGTPLPEQYIPKLEKGWVESPELVVKKPKYAFKPAKPLSGIKVLD